MYKYIFDENNGLWYELQDDYYIPCLSLSAEDERPLYCGASSTCVTSSKADINQQAQKQLYTIIQLIAQDQGATGVLKAFDQTA